MEVGPLRLIYESVRNLMNGIYGYDLHSTIEPIFIDIGKNYF